MASELHSWIFELEIVQSRLACGHPYRHVFEPKLNAQQCAICEAFFSKCFEQSTSWSFGSHFFVARSHRFIATCHCRFLASFLKEKHGTKTPLTTFHYNSIGSTRSACFKICQTASDSILFKPLLSHAGQLSCLDVNFSCSRRSCSKRRVCFHANRYESPPTIQKRISAVFYCQQKDQSWSGSGAMSEIISTTKSA